MKTQAGLDVIVTGSRAITDYFAMTHVIELSGMKIQELVRGGARSVNSPGKRYAREYRILIRLFPADLERFGKSAGYQERVAEYVDSLIAIGRRLRERRT